MKTSMRRRITFTSTILLLKVNLLINISTGHQGEQKLQYEVENFNSTKDGESSKESHGASNGADLVFKRHARVFADLVVCCCAEIDLDCLQWMIIETLSFKTRFF